MDSYLEDIQQKREDQLEARQKADAHKALLQSQKTASKQITDAITKQHELDRVVAKQKKKVDIDNLPDLALREDIAKVVTALDSLKKENKPEKIEWTPIVEALNELGKKLDLLPQSMPEAPEAPEAVTVKNLSEFKDALKPLIDAVNSKNYEPIFKPNIKVDSPEVNVDAPDVDLSGITKSIKDLGEKLSKTLTNNTIDLSPVIEATSATTQAINNLQFPVPNYILPFKDTNGKAVQIQLDSSGNLPITGGAGGSSYSKPTDEYDLIQDDDTSSASYEYYGYMKSDGGWFIKRITLSTNLREYVKGTSGYSTEWTNRSTQTYADYGSTF